MIKILIFTHGELGSGILKTAQCIVGEQKDIFVFALSSKDSLVSVTKNLKEFLDRESGEEGVLIMTDMAGGTPCNASLALSKEHNIEIVTGANLYMVISAIMNRNSLKLKELSVKIIEDAKKNITNAKEVFLNKIK